LRHCPLRRCPLRHCPLRRCPRCHCRCTAKQHIQIMHLLGRLLGIGVSWFLCLAFSSLSTCPGLHQPLHLPHQVCSWFDAHSPVFVMFHHLWPDIPRFLHRSAWCLPHTVVIDCYLDDVVVPKAEFAVHWHLTWARVTRKWR
jgi:hypothetical protein